MTRVLIVIGILLILLVFSLWGLRAADAAEIGLAWDQNDPVPDGYRVFQRIEGGQYDYTKPVCDTKETKCTVIGLVPATLYHFVARAYMGTDESGDSNEVQFAAPVPAPSNFRVEVKVSVYIDVNGKPVIQAESNQQSAK